MESSKKILNNCEILEAIFRYLDFKDHLKLIKICPQFEDAIVHGVWRSMYKHLHISHLFLDSLLLQYNAVNNVKGERILTSKEVYTILQHSSMYIHKLELKHISLQNIISLKYQNLTELSVNGALVQDTHLQQVAKNCINLQSFTMTPFTNDYYRTNISANFFGEMKALNKLEINDINFDAWNYFDVQQLFCLPLLKTLIINIKIRDSNDNNGSNNDSTGRVCNIENLTIQTLPYLQSANACFVKDLIRFENLTKLSLTLKAVSIDNNVLTQMNNGCPKLCELSLTGCDFSCNEFPRMNNLKYLTFKLCKNIQLKTFDEIFRNLKLKSLSLMDVRMRHEAEHISDYNYISNTLETLNIKLRYDDQNIVRTFFNRQHKFENVSKISLETDLEDTHFSSRSTGLYFSHNFPNLRELIMDLFHISAEDILHLKHLKVLEFKLFDNMSWSYLEMLFKHPTLTHVTITELDCQYFPMQREHFHERSEGLTTTLEYLSLPLVVYAADSRFWLSFRQRNKLLKLEVVEGKWLESSDDDIY